MTRPQDALIVTCLILGRSAVCLLRAGKGRRSCPPRAWPVAGKIVAEVGWVSPPLP